MWCGAQAATIDARALEAHLLGAARALQGPARDRVRRKPAAQRAGQGAALRAARTGARLMRIAVLGGGNGSFAAAGDFALAGHEVRLWRRDSAAVDGAQRGRRHDPGEGFSRAARGEAVARDQRHRRSGARRRADPLPGARDRAARHRPRVRAASQRRTGRVPAARHVRLVLFAKAAHDAGNRADVAFAETGTLPWLTRKHGPFEVAITVRAKRLPTGVFPLRLKDHALT